MKTFTFCSFKGGTSKTSTALHMGACLAQDYDKKILLVDFDPQANLSYGLGVGPDKLNTMVPVLKGQLSIQDVIFKTNQENLSMIPANAYLDGIERSPEIVNDLYAHEKLRKALEEIRENFDYCFIDTPPSLGWLTQTAFYASQHSIICAIPEAYSIIALRRLKEFHESIKQHHGVNVFGVVLTFWDERGAINKQMLKEIMKSFPRKVFCSKVRRDIAVSRAALQGKTVFDFEKTARAGSDYRELTKEFVVNMRLYAQNNI